MKDQLLIIFIKNPVLGKVKTRLAESIGNEAALAIYLQLLNKTKEVTQPLAIDKVVYYSDVIDYSDLWENEDYEKALQHGKDLGEKMSNAFSTAFQNGYKRVCIIGSDCLEITPEIIAEAFNALQTKSTVIGPAQDGGYYLLGMTKYIPQLFENKQWSTDEVFISTLEDFSVLKLTHHELPVLRDLDNKKDLDQQKIILDSSYLLK